MSRPQILVSAGEAFGGRYAARLVERLREFALKPAKKGEPIAMPMIEPMLAELEQESAATIRLLERVPEDKLSWRPHPKSMSLGQLALHIAGVPAQLTKFAQLDSLELPQFTQPEATSRRQLLDTYKESLAAARAGLSEMSDARLLETWNVTKGERVLMSLPRLGLVRGLLLNHSYHHRGQLTVYLRLLDVPLPSVYGPSADENPFQ